MTKGPTSDVAIPAATPAWITPELVAHTLRVWQPYYRERLTVADAVDIIVRVGRLCEVLSRERAESKRKQAS